MAYNVYVACDICGADSALSCNETCSITKAVTVMRRRGWDVTYKGSVSFADWICPECRKGVAAGVIKPLHAEDDETDPDE